MKPASTVERALQLSAAGLNNCEISRELSVNRRTISDWVRGRTRSRGPKGSCRATPACFRCADLTEPMPGVTMHAYAYLLGLYLGDGMISSHPRGVYRLRVFLDRAYPVIVAECHTAMGLVIPTSRVAILRHRRAHMDEVSSYSKHWPHLFPQHGSGLKHLREIALERWQGRIIEHYSGRLLRGLIHSDGCRAMNIIRHPKKTYGYPRYFFTNRSLDIQRIFCDTCDQLGIAWRQDGPWNLSVARREAVATMDRHVGPKR